MSEKKWTREQLEKAVKGNGCWSHILKELGLCIGSSNQRRIIRWTKEYNLDTSHFNVYKHIKPDRRSWNIEQLKQAVIDSLSIRQVALKLGLSDTTTNYATIRHAIKVEGISTQHFDSTKILNPRNNRSLNEYLVKADRPLINSSTLRKKLIKAGILENKCARCGINPIWCNEELTFELDHINGDRNDNRLENLRILCPNCHSQTPTYSKKRRTSGGIAQWPRAESC